MTKIEEVARAICIGVCGGPCQCSLWTAYMDSARAAIEALREPSAAMTVGHWTTLEYSGDTRETCHAVWREMIDAILSEGK